MKKWLLLLLCLCMLPLFAAAEDALSLPEGYRVEDFGDFTMPIAPNAILKRYDKDADDGYVAEITYLDLSCQDFAPYIIVFWQPNNLSAYLKRAHPLEYAKVLRDDVVKLWREAGMTITSPEAVYGQRQGDMQTCMVSARIEENSWFCDHAHNLWMVQRYLGTYEMGTYVYEIYAESRQWADRLIKELDRIEYRK